ncbi:MAG: ribonuclease R [Ignavibacteria bacterium RIFOXYB2_FULL_35_12]|nr:MAG: ribonuclease R [Ignavibacteria bacterium GWA2_36_19]OGU49902.1 MAG: ribonuclease R [Ignavibacteria bacterium GWC2_35_8]OGU57434.1 MAG: ribonuclease R [Ignavibacteria bacterium GWF2_35_20]OGU83573.1 MAG: ribonuclease R [Ignavibacteria bacterium RIFOXYA2_FULL_35_9]OGU88371.1 MAG: ribonuclease R [Ignavibacteria bacterium RIFOXYC12_FULL_35_11]OGU91558.1 MAG: ribonuclease R [Ignavibacteria bacterium RIFOXYA12_FULL_35_25]OGU97898.1 MAG: ribonuclease R [Ignavibacteria bacterium RIFOXYB12_FUL
MKKKIISFFKKNAGTAFKSKEIAKRLKLVSEEELVSLKHFLYQLYEENFLTRNGKRYKLNQNASSGKVAGELQISPGGFGFVVPKDKKLGDIFIASRNLSTAFSGDTVEVALFAKSKGKNVEGQIVDIISRKRNNFVGTLRRSHVSYFVKPDEPEIHRDIYVDKENLKGAKEGDKVIVGNLIWDTSLLNPEGEIIELIGKSGTKDAEISSIAHEFNLPLKFSPKTLEEAERISENFSQEDLKNRIDFRNQSVFTIDPVDAKDFDDALSIEILENDNYRIGIHIADVSHYVSIGSLLDKEALERGNSVYLVGGVIPMLPEKLSNNICSLVPNKDRMTYSVIVEITKRGKVENYQIKKTIINSKRRFTYDEVQEIIENGKGDFEKEVLLLNEIAQILRKKRFRDGGIEFSTPEIRFDLDENNKPVAIYRKDAKESNMLVEEFMLLANKICAAHISTLKNQSGKPFVYRIHDYPDAEKIIEFSKFVKSLGFSFDPDLSKNTKQFHSLMLQIKGREEEALINELAIRSMAKAVYSTKNIGHYGLGFKYYTHFTSPIRRYSDLIVHRNLFNYLEGSKKSIYSPLKLEEISNHLSATERSAVEAERLYIKIKQIEYLESHIGESFHAVISGVTHFGLFVKILDILAEGLIRVRDLEGDFYVYDEKKYSLIGRRTKKQYRLGDKVWVKLVRVDQEKSELDFIITEQ